MLDTQRTKLIWAVASILALLLIYVSPLFSNWMFGYVAALGTFGRHVTVFVAYLVFILAGQWILNKMFGVS